MKGKTLFRWLRLLGAWLCFAGGETISEVAVVDRIVDRERAVLIVGDPPHRQLEAPVGDLPVGARAGHWLEVTLDGGRLTRATIDADATERARQRTRAGMDVLRERGRKLE